MLYSTLAVLASLNGADAFWRMICKSPITEARLDPIISPGGVSMHAHSITGPSNFNKDSTFDSLRASDCTTCATQQDKSAYWVPQLYYVGADGKYKSVDQVGGMTVYYLQRGQPNADGKYRAFPAGLRMVAGNPFKRTYDASSIEAQQIGFSCLGGTGYTKDIRTISNCANGLRAEVFFPNCWDGVNLDSPDHKSHMAYSGLDGNGACPSSHPVKLISIFYEAMWNVNAFADRWWNGTTPPFVFAQGDPTGFGSHGDFMSGWDESVLQQAIDTCTNNSGRLEDCPVFNLQWDVAAKCAWTGGLAVTEDVWGPRSTLPGCNPVTYGPADAPVRPATCPDGSLVVVPTLPSPSLATSPLQLPTPNLGAIAPVGLAAQQSSSSSSGPLASSSVTGGAANLAPATVRSSPSSSSIRWSNSSSIAPTGTGAVQAVPVTLAPGTTIAPTVYTTVVQGQVVVSTTYVTITLGSAPAVTAAPAVLQVVGSTGNAGSGNSNGDAAVAPVAAAGNGHVEVVRTVVETIYATITRTAYSTQTLTLDNGQATTTVSRYVQLYVLPASLTSMLTQQRVITATANIAAAVPTVTSTVYQTTTHTFTPGLSSSPSAVPSIPANGTFFNGTIVLNNGTLANNSSSSRFRRH